MLIGTWISLLLISFLAFPKDNIREVLKLVGTKWNVEAFHPGIGAGGYCIPLSSRYILSQVKI